MVRILGFPAPRRGRVYSRVVRRRHARVARDHEEMPTAGSKCGSRPTGGSPSSPRPGRTNPDRGGVPASGRGPCPTGAPACTPYRRRRWAKPRKHRERGELAPPAPVPQPPGVPGGSGAHNSSSHPRCRSTTETSSRWDRRLDPARPKPADRTLGSVPSRAPATSPSPARRPCAAGVDPRDLRRLHGARRRSRVRPRPRGDPQTNIVGGSRPRERITDGHLDRLTSITVRAAYAAQDPLESAVQEASEAASTALHDLRDTTTWAVGSLVTTGYAGSGGALRNRWRCVPRPPATLVRTALGPR